MTCVQIRPISPGDEDRIAALAAACESDSTLAVFTGGGWRHLFRDGGAHMVAIHDDAVVSVLLVGGADFRIIVRPDMRRRGIGSRLLPHVPPHALRTSCDVRASAGIAFLGHHGFTVEDRTLTMAREGDPPDPATLPDGVRLRPYERTDDAAWIALNDEAYAGSCDHRTLSDEVLAGFRSQCGFHLWVAEEQGRPVGLCHTFLWLEQWPCVNSVVVTASARGRGLGRALTVAGVRTLAEAGHARVELEVRAENTSALRIYQSLGFVAFNETIRYRR